MSDLRKLSLPPGLSLTDAVRPRLVVSLTLLFMLAIWSIAWYSISSQVGKPFPGFFINPERVVSGFTPPEFTGWQAGLRPWDRIIAINGEHWREMPRLVQEAGIGGELVYTIERGGRQIDITVPTMAFTSQILLGVLPGYLVSSAVFLLIGIFVYLRNPSAAQNRYLLAYLLVWSIGGAIVWECYLSQNKWLSYLLIPYAVTAPVAGWIFFWTFPADSYRRKFLQRWPVGRIFSVLAAATITLMTSTQVLANVLDKPALWRALVFMMGWPYFLVFGLGSIPMKSGPLLAILLRKSSRPLRQQAAVMLVGLLAGLSGWYLFLWAPAAVHVAPAARTQWGGLVPAIYPLSIGYAILRYRLLDIQVIFRKGLVYSLLTAALTAMFMLLSLLSGYLYQLFTASQSLLAMVLAALLVAIFFQPVRSRIQLFVDRSFFRQAYETQQALADFSHNLSTLRGQAEVVQLVEKTISQTFGARNAVLWLAESGHYLPVSDSPPLEGNISGSSALAAQLIATQRAYYPQPDEDSKAAQELRETGALLAVPLFRGEKLSGILTLDERQSGTAYSQDDIGLFATLASSTALALENSRLYEERLQIVRRQFLQTTAIQEEERRRIARELHDGVGPNLASLSIRLQTMRKQLERESHPATAEVEELAEQAQRSIHDIRRLIYDLRPAALDELGLIPALQNYAERFEKEQDVTVHLYVQECQNRLPETVETTLFRIAQEALANVGRHAQAKRVDISLTQNRNYVCLSIIDNGRGFDPEEPRAGTHLGLWSMQKRVEQFGGCIDITSAPGHGAQIKVQIPLDTSF